MEKKNEVCELLHSDIWRVWSLFLMSSIADNIAINGHINVTIILIRRFLLRLKWPVVIGATHFVVPLDTLFVTSASSMFFHCCYHDLIVAVIVIVVVVVVVSGYIEYYLELSHHHNQSCSHERSMLVLISFVHHRILMADEYS